MNIHSILEQLSNKRPVFANEADFQHSLALQIQLTHPDAKIRFEVKPPGTRVYLDLLVTYQSQRIAIELKYPQRKLHVEIGGEWFSLEQHSAQDQRRYDLLRDVKRLEQVVSEGFVDVGIAICLTNDFNYWNPPSQVRKTIFEAFRLTEGRLLTGELSWGVRASRGSIRGRTEPIRLQGEHTVRWRPYSKLPSGRNGEFRYLVFEIERVFASDNKYQPNSEKFI